MKASRYLVVLVLLIMLGAAWTSFIGGVAKESREISNYVTLAEESIEAGLYEQAIEYYRQAAEVSGAKKHYLRIKDTYDLFYADEAAGYVRTRYIDDMLKAAEKFPKDPYFWSTAVALQMEAERYKDAYSTVMKAKNRGAGDEQLDEFLFSLQYMEKVDYKLYSCFTTALNGYITVSTGSNWYVIDNLGNVLTEQYSYVGLLNESGYGIYQMSDGARLLDQNEIARARYDGLTVEQAGYYSESADYAPVLVDGRWIYLNREGEQLPGTFEMAGSFQNRLAAVKRNGAWEIIDDTGQLLQETRFSDIKLDLAGNHLQSGVIIAQENNQYRLYDEDIQPIGDFYCDEIDFCIEDGWIAFKRDGKWGYVNSKGQEILAPQFIQAKSFSGNFAAVCNEDGLWGFVNQDFELVIDYKYVDAHYFNSAKTCLVSKAEGSYQLLSFLF